MQMDDMWMYNGLMGGEKKLNEQIDEEWMDDMWVGGWLMDGWVMRYWVCG